MKKILTIMLLIIFVFILVGCQKNHLEDFKSAVDRTKEIKQGKMLTESKVSLDFNTEDMSEEEIKDLSYLKNVDVKMDITFDEDPEKMISRGYFNFGGLGFDTVIYVNGEETFVKMPMLGKYMIVSDMFKEKEAQEQTNELEKNQEDEFVSKETKDVIKNGWVSLLEEDNVFSGKDSILTTPDGEVKATKYTINLDDGQIKELLNEILDTISKDEKLKGNIEKYLNQSIDDVDRVEEFDMQNMINELITGINKSEIKEFSYISYVDIDGYIVQEDINVEIEFPGGDSKKITGLTYEFSLDRWSINSEQKFDFPELTGDNMLDIGKFDQGMPFMFEDFIN